MTSKDQIREPLEGRRSTDDVHYVVVSGPRRALRRVMPHIVISRV